MSAASKLNLSFVSLCERTRKITIRCTREFAEALRSRYQGDDFFFGVEALGQGQGYYHLYPRSWDLQTKNPISRLAILCLLHNAMRELEKLWARMQKADFTEIPVKVVGEKQQLHNGPVEMVVTGRLSTAQHNSQPMQVTVSKSTTSAAADAATVNQRVVNRSHRPVITIPKKPASNILLSALMQKFSTYR
jgi:hypothetical protein